MVLVAGVMMPVNEHVTRMYVGRPLNHGLVL